MPKDPLKVLSWLPKCAEQKCWTCPTVRAGKLQSALAFWNLSAVLIFSTFWICRHRWIEVIFLSYIVLLLPWCHFTHIFLSNPLREGVRGEGESIRIHAAQKMTSKSGERARALGLRGYEWHSQWYSHRNSNSKLKQKIIKYQGPQFSMCFLPFFGPIPHPLLFFVRRARRLGIMFLFALKW